MRKEPKLKSSILLAIASVKAHQGRLTEALDDLSKVEPNLRMQDFYEERAEIKSLLGFDDSAIQDMDFVLKTNSGQWQTWQSLWHESVILERAGKHNEAKYCMRQALTNLQRFKPVPNLFSNTFLKEVQDKSITAIESDQKKQDTALALIQTLLQKTSAPELTETLTLLGLDKESLQKSQSRDDRYLPLSSDCPFRFATITPDGLQIRVFLDSTACLLSPDVIRKHFSTATEQEMGGLGGCGAGTLTLYPKDTTLQSQFLFDGGKEPALSMFFIAYKKPQTLN